MLGCLIVVVGLLAQHGVGRHQHLHAARRVRSAARDLEALGIPGLQRLGARGDGIHHPLPCRRPLSANFHHGVDHADLQRIERLDALAFHQQGCGRLHAGQARQALRAAGAGQQAQRDFGKTEARLGIVGRDAMMASQRDFHAAAQGRTVERCGDGLAAQLDAAHELVPVVDRGMESRRVGGARQFGQVAAGDEILLRRGDHDALHRRVGQRLPHGFGIGTHGHGVEDVLRLAGVIEFDGGDAFGIH